MEFGGEIEWICYYEVYVRYVYYVGSGYDDMGDGGLIVVLF